MSHLVHIIYFEIKCLLHNIIHCPKVLFSRQINCKHSLLTNVRVKVSGGVKLISAILFSIIVRLFYLATIALLKSEMEQGLKIQDSI